MLLLLMCCICNCCICRFRDRRAERRGEACPGAAGPRAAIERLPRGQGGGGQGAGERSAHHALCWVGCSFVLARALFSMFTWPPVCFAAKLFVCNCVAVGSNASR